MRVDNIGNQLKLNGYYYTKISNTSPDTLINMVFLYHNGTISYISTFNHSRITTETEIKNGEYDQYLKNSKNNWGPYRINESNLYFERWYPQDSQPIHGYNCKILNDTTFELYETFNMVRGKQKNKRSMNEIYRFKKFSPKPDSTNKFVK